MREPDEKNLILRCHFRDQSPQEGHLGDVIPHARNSNPSHQVFVSRFPPLFQGTGCCWLMQWIAPNPFTSARQSIPITSRSGKTDARIALARASFGW